MYPVLFQIPIFGGITIYSYGFFVALSFLVGMLWVGRESKRIGLDPAKMMDLAFYIIIAAIIGSRVLHVLVSDRARFLSDPLMIFRIWEGGLVFYGGVIGSIIISIWYVRRHRLSFLLTSDVFAPAVAIGHFFGRLGCLSAGCCYGRLAQNTWFSMTFPDNPQSFAPGGVPLYPTQLLEAFGELLIFGMLFLLRYKKRFDGQLAATYLIAYSILRSIVEYYRGDTSRGFIIEPWISTSTFISILMFAIGFIIYFKKWKRQ